MLGSLQKTKIDNCHTDSEDLSMSHADSLDFGPECVSFHKLRSAVSVGFPIMILTALAHIIPPSSLQLDSRSSAWCLPVDLYICGHHLLDEDSIVTIRVVADLISGEDQLSSLHYC